MSARGSKALEMALVILVGLLMAAGIILAGLALWEKVTR